MVKPKHDRWSSDTATDIPEAYTPERFWKLWKNAF